ncbi:TonB-dependent receptor [Arenibacter sp. ARW7G5Y1]|uniref:TonB-dependent receptor n=1 Tax=Arenibacter sp. ARW7G5Y1 TaxID=2135619 RepID=UPI000D8C1CA4|nr:TonB-dependent receptor [Arenibacter sp. ARW7G5Y1]PXX31302.1 TonB-linked SusC/RagA family outer membrane protein [Arenibacter sp. ARW7G5Y1]
MKKLFNRLRLGLTLLKFDLRMKLTALLLITTFLGLHANDSYAQKTKVSLDVENTAIKEVIDNIEFSTKFKFVYKTRHVDLQRKVSLKITKGHIDRVLKLMFGNTNTSYKLRGTQIILWQDSTKSVPEEQPKANTIVPLQEQLTGQISDLDGNVLPGATVIIEGTSAGVIADFDGRYSIAVKPDQMLAFSYIGMETQLIKYVGQKTLDVFLESKLDELEEVTVVAFGKQKKESVIASVSTINPSELKIPSSNLTTALAGRMAGIISYQRSGEPGRDNAEFFIRGVTTFGYKKSPLILIDGIELTATDLARLQPDDIASFSIMKDATATALYGARGANGVILVNTKEGKEGPAKLNFRYERTLSTPTRALELADPVTYMKLHNEAIRTRDPLGGRAYSLEKIRQTEQLNRNEMVYPAVDWFDEMFEESTFNDRFNFNVSGGGKIARYYLAATLNTDNGILKVDKRNNFNNNVNVKNVSLRSNVNIDITKTTEVGVRFSANFDDYNGPIDGGETLFRKALQTNPVLYPKYYEPDAQYANTQHILFGNDGQNGDYLNAYADMVRGYKEENRSKILASVEIKQDLEFITEGLSARAMGNTTRESFFNVSRGYRPFYYSLASYDAQIDEYSLFALNPNDGSEFLEYDEGNKDVATAFYAEAAINYNRTFNQKHTTTAMLVGIMREQKIANAGNLQKSLPYRNMGVSGRLTYAYDSRLFTEFNFGYNGSERFAKQERYGFFPSMGLGWVVSNEKAWKSVKEVVNKLKLKATYGLVGNDAIGNENDRFFYISQVNMNDGGRGVSFGQDYFYQRNGISINRYSNNQISWETAKMTNIGFELGLFNKLDFQWDYFREKRTNVLMDRSQVPSSMGLQAPLRANIGEASSDGFEGTLDYQESFANGLWLSARGNFTYATSKFDVYEELDYVGAGLPWKSRIGNSLNQPYGYIAERLFVDEADIVNSPFQTFGEYMPGDIKYKDINEDGVIDSNDEVPIGFPDSPEIIYGFGASVGYKNVDFSFFFQGSARSSFFIDGYKTAPFIDINDSNNQDSNWNSKNGNNALLQVWADDHWSEDDRDIYAAWPRLSDQVVDNNNRRSTWFLKNGDFLRLKSVELGYTFNKDTFISKAKIASMRIYLSGTNLLTFSHFKLWDVEMGGNGLGYPIQKVFNLGVNLNF